MLYRTSCYNSFSEHQFYLKPMRKIIRDSNTNAITLTIMIVCWQLQYHRIFCLLKFNKPEGKLSTILLIYTIAVSVETRSRPCLIKRFRDSLCEYGITTTPKHNDSRHNLCTWSFFFCSKVTLVSLFSLSKRRIDGDIFWHISGMINLGELQNANKSPPLGFFLWSNITLSAYLFGRPHLLSFQISTIIKLKVGVS